MRGAGTVTAAGAVRPVEGAPGFVVDWRAPAGRPDWLLGAGTTPGERATVAVATAAGTAGVVAAAATTSWAPWQWAVVLVLAVDVVGGVTANALSTAKRQYHGPRDAGAGRGARLLRSSPAFTAAHVHPLVLALLLPGAGWGWATFWYAGCLASVLAVHAVPLHLRRPVAFGALATLLVAAGPVGAPAGLAWFGPVLAVKLVAAHAVREEPYRPAPPDASASAAPGGAS
ncbi:hypothetical protein ACFUMH_08335 [Cellulomonas sp. NPDC057328]|uniref:hypothetical protein n=1 Tax=Cellulomonas sp. NPDC057328 TaxID=3346101 RepID=UPI00363BE91F